MFPRDFIISSTVTSIDLLSDFTVEIRRWNHHQRNEGITAWEKNRKEAGFCWNPASFAVTIEAEEKGGEEDETDYFSY